MRRVFSGFGRGVATAFGRGVAMAAVVLALTVPAAEAKPRDDGSKKPQQFVKVVKRWIQTVLFDRLSEPKP